MMKTRGPTVAKMMQGEETPVTFDIAGCIKDLQSMQAEGRSRGISLPLVQLTLACMEESASKGLAAKEAAAHSVCTDALRNGVRLLSRCWESSVRRWNFRTE